MHPNNTTGSLCIALSNENKEYHAACCLSERNGSRQELVTRHSANFTTAIGRALDEDVGRWRFRQISIL